MNTELELLKRIDERNYLTEREHKEFYGIVEKALINAQDIEKENAEYKNLEKKFGCSLDFIFKVLSAPEIYLEGMNVYSEYNKEFRFHRVRNDYILNPEIFIYKNVQFLFVNRWSYGYDLRLKDYKKTWWLKEDRSE